MSAIILNGKKLAEKIKNELAIKIKDLGIKPQLAVIRVGNDPASKTYIRAKATACAEVGIKLREEFLPESASFEELQQKVGGLNKNLEIDGIIIQLPLPQHVDTIKAVNLINSTKDADGLTAYNQGYLYMGYPKIIPATPLGAIKLLDEYKINLDGKQAVVIGRSNLVGRPLAALLEQRNSTVTVCHRHTINLKEITKQADIIASAAGKSNLITGDMIKPRAVVLDIGINHLDGKICGDADFETVKELAGAISPVPGGIGPLTVACLLENLLTCYQQRRLK